jgi:hypothetical protein
VSRLVSPPSPTSRSLLALTLTFVITCVMETSCLG